MPPTGDDSTIVPPPDSGGVPDVPDVIVPQPILGTFSGNLLKDNANAGNFVFSVNDAGVVSNAKMHLINADGTHEYYLAGGVGNITNRTVEVVNWNKAYNVAGKTEVSKAGLKTTFNDNAQPTGVTWAVKDGSNNTLWDGSGGNDYGNADALIIPDSNKLVSGFVSGTLQGASDGQTGFYQFTVEPRTAVVTNAVIELSKNGKPTYGAYKESANFLTNRRQFRIDWSSGEVKDYVNGLSTIIGNLGADFDDTVNNVQGVSWAVTNMKNGNLLGKGAGTIDNHLPYPTDPTTLPYTSLYGGFKGDLSGSDNVKGVYQFNVALGSGIIHDAGINLMNAENDRLFTAVGGTGSVAANKSFSVENWDNQNAASGDNLMATMSGKMTTGLAGGAVKSLNWNITSGDPDDVKWSGTGTNHTHTPERLSEMAISNSVSGTFYGMLEDNAKSTVGAYQLNVKDVTSANPSGEVALKVVSGSDMNISKVPLTYNSGTGKLAASGKFSSTLSGQTLTGITWESAGKLGTGSDPTFAAGIPIELTTPNPKSVFGYFNGNLQGADIATSESTFSFNVQLGSGAVSDAAMKVVASDNPVTLFTGTGGSGTITADSTKLPFSATIDAGPGSPNNFDTGVLSGTFTPDGKLATGGTWQLMYNGAEQLKGQMLPDRGGVPQPVAPSSR